MRRASERGSADHGWLDTRHTFSFAEYQDPEHVRFRSLRVINEDRVQAGKGFGTHGHRDMEILSFVISGALKHRDSLGTGSVIRPGDVQRMSAGTGVEHSEFNGSDTEGVHFYQVWILPESRGIEPSYEQKSFPDAEKRDRLRLVASRDGRDGSVTIHQDASVFAAILSPGTALHHALEPGRGAWVQVVRGSLSVDGTGVSDGDGVAVEDQGSVTLAAASDSAETEVLLFDLGA